MNEWFTIEQIDKATFAISEYGHWEEPHSYLLLGSETNLLIDSGLGVASIREKIFELTDKEPFVITTHAHWSQIGGLKEFSSFGVHRVEQGWLKEYPTPLEIVRSNLIKQPNSLSDDFNVNEYFVYQGSPSLIYDDGYILNLGDRQIRVVHTPGHSPGHCCFFEPEKDYLFTGDLIHSGRLTASDPIVFMQSVKKVKKLDPKTIFPGHHKLDISDALIDSVYKAFSNLYRSGLMNQGSGAFNFNNFSINF